ncbi:PREDICTED: serine/threonine/tyrosine-interacting-like protein 1 [Gekko japonicus]|uniref:Serine/threonine/tyrosine-interacting-like protein 1 n=1 Tax=Gekko japonicus TaxID=146911 RepID=A0ABM1JRQ0_GEKJA|nr:PREDICTED: serine/threonine/tyrosine-interacting-like protein 1 [Gekko japonicus]XP_015268683.1 PREDICTED: serine/threonine/tyrosine-interacting-like protein 1 [Gekko japonicus]
MTGVELCEPVQLYNILNQATRSSRLAERNYLCLIDARTKREYDESHLITAIRVKQDASGSYVVPPSVDLEFIRHCVVYDGTTNLLDVTSQTDATAREVDEERNARPGSALRCARVLQRYTRFPVQILRGGYERFTASYHFLRTQKVFWMPRELEDFLPYPVEIVPDKLYMGNSIQACHQQIQKDLKIQAHVNVSEEVDTFFPDDSDRVLHISVPDSPEADISPYFSEVCHYIDSNMRRGGVLVFSTLGISRCSTVVLAYLIHSCRLYLKNAWSYLQKCKSNIRPNRGFVQQLSDWETRVYLATITDISEPGY